MKKNIKIMFLITTTILLLVGIGTITATDVDNQTTYNIKHAGEKTTVNATLPTKEDDKERNIIKKNNEITKKQDKICSELNIKFAQQDAEENLLTIHKNDNYTINITLSSDKGNEAITGQVFLYFGDNNDPLEISIDTTGHTSKTFTAQDIGEYYIHAEYFGNDYYEKTSSETLILNVDLNDYNLTLNEIDNTCYNSSIVISGMLYKEDQPMKNKDINILFNDNFLTAVQTNQYGEYFYLYSLENIAVQNKVIVGVTYESENPDYNDAYNESIFDIEKIANFINMDKIENKYINDTINIKGRVIDENNKRFNGILNITINNKDTNKTVYSNTTIPVTDGQYSINYTPQKAGNYNLTILTKADDYYMQSYYVYDFEIQKYIPEIIVEEEYEVLVKDNISVNASITNKNNLPLNDIEIILETNDTILEKTLTDDDGKILFSQHIFSEIPEDGYYKVYFKIENNDIYQDIMIESKIVITRRNTNISLQADEHVKLMGTLHINGQVTDSYDENIVPQGSVLLFINDEIVKNIQLVNGRYDDSIIIGNKYKANESLKLTVFFNADNKNVYYDDNYVGYNVTLDIINTTLQAESKEARINETTSIKIILFDEYDNRLNKTVNVQIYDSTRQLLYEDNPQLTNGTTSITFTPNTEGMYMVIVSYDGEVDTYAPVTTEYQLAVNKIDTKIIPENLPNKLYVNDTIKISGKLLDINNNPLADEYIEIYIDTTKESLEYKVKTDTDGNYEYYYTVKNNNTLNLTVAYNDTGNYYGSYINTSIIIEKYDTIINLDKINTTIKYNNTISISGQVQRLEDYLPVNGSVTIKVNNQTLDTITLNHGRFDKEYSVDVVGKNNNITVIFNENEVYLPTKIIHTFDTEALETNIKINLINTTEINKKVVITGIITDENSNPLTTPLIIRINDEQIMDYTINNSIFIINYQTNKIGINTINITVQQDNLHYYSNSIKETFNVIKTNLQLENTEIATNSINNTITIRGQLTNSNNIPTDNIKSEIIINNQSINITTKDDGVFEYTTDKLLPGKYTIGFVVNETEYFNKLNTILADKTIDKYTTVISMEKITNSTYSKDLPIKGRLTDEYGRPLAGHNISIILNNEKYNTITGVDGKYNVTLNNFDAGINTICISVSETVNTYKNNLTKTFTTKKDTATITLDNITNTNPGDTLKIRGQLKNSQEEALINRTLNIKVNNITYTSKSDAEGIFHLDIPNIVAGKYDITVCYEDNNHEKTAITKIYNISKLTVKIIVSDITARVGENITFMAKLIDQYDNPVNGGNLVFKLNGRTLRADGRFDTNTKDVLKIRVHDGMVNITLTADLYLRHGKNISASYSGSYRYESAKSNVAQAKIQLRYATINVTTKTSTVKHHENITFIAKLSDTTPNSNKNLLNDTRVIFKINGVSVKDSQNRVIKVNVKDNMATLNYNVTNMAGITKDYAQRNYTVTAVFENQNYYPVNNRNTTTFNVERSSVNISVNEVKVTDNKLSINAKLTDYLGYDVSDKNKICIKINGITYKENSKNKYYIIKDGRIIIQNIDVSNIKVKSLEIVSGERLAYLSSRKLVTDISY